MSRPEIDEVSLWDALRLGRPDEVLAWQASALCAQVDPDAWFPDKGGSTRQAKQVCATCPVRVECLDYALAHDERFGVWGGLAERERRRLTRKNSPAGVRRHRFALRGEQLSPGGERS